jgi:5-methyltetrahydropteroyltriglutamate--homocysteine methyltransferase
MADRFLTTHVGSLPRAADLLEHIIAREEGAAVDEAALNARIELAVADVVAKQATAGIDVINDGEQSKPSFRARCSGWRD